MSVISVTSINDGDAVTAASVNNQVNTIVNDYNGNITAANLASNAVTDAKITANNLLVTKLNNLYKFSVYQTAAFNVATGATNPFKFDTKDYDTGTNYSVSTGLFTAPVAGFYIFSWIVGWIMPANAFYQTSIAKNGTKYIGNTVINLSNNNNLGIPCCPPPIQLAANDTIGVIAENGGASGSGLTGRTATYFGGYLLSSI